MGDYLCSFTDCVSQRRGRRVLDRPSTVALTEKKEERGADGADGSRGHVHSDGGSRGPLGCEQRLPNPADTKTVERNSRIVNERLSSAPLLGLARHSPISVSALLSFGTF